MPVSSFIWREQVHDLRLHGHVERGCRLVGDEQLPGGWPCRWRSSRAGACRRNIGAEVARPHLRLRECGRRAACRWRPLPDSASAYVRCAWIVSPICRPTRITGLSEAAGSWKIMPISLPRTRRISPRADRADRGRSSRSARRRSRPGSGTSRMMDRASIDLPQPDSPTMPTTSPRATAKETPSTASTRPRGLGMWTLKVLKPRAAGSALMAESDGHCVRLLLPWPYGRRWRAVSAAKWQADCMAVGAGQNRRLGRADRSGLPSAPRSQQRVWNRQPPEGARARADRRLSRMCAGLGRASLG